MVGIVGCISEKDPTEIEKIIQTMSSRLYHRGEFTHYRLVKLSQSVVPGFHVAIRTLAHIQADPFIEMKGNIGLIDSVSHISRTGDIAERILESQLLENDSFSIQTMSGFLRFVNLYTITKSGVTITRSLDGQRMLYTARADNTLFFAS